MFNLLRVFFFKFYGFQTKRHKIWMGFYRSFNDTTLIVQQLSALNTIPWICETIPYSCRSQLKHLNHKQMTNVNEKVDISFFFCCVYVSPIFTFHYSIFFFSNCKYQMNNISTTTQFNRMSPKYYLQWCHNYYL